MEIQFSEEFTQICSEIIKEAKSQDEWAEIESDDMFQSQHYAGGYDADEMAFCFSFFNNTGDEFWFQLTLDEVEAVVKGSLNRVSARPAE